MICNNLLTEPFFLGCIYIQLRRDFSDLGTYLQFSTLCMPFCVWIIFWLLKIFPSPCWKAHEFPVLSHKINVPLTSLSSFYIVEINFLRFRITTPEQVFYFLYWRPINVVALDEILHFADWLLTFNMLSDVDSLKWN